MKKTILSLPMMPVKGDNYGKFVTPIICEAFRNLLNGEFYYCVNLLDSFHDRNQLLPDYIESLNDNDIKYDKMWIDSQNISCLLDNIELLIKKGFVDEIYSNIYRCNCGVVEIEENKIFSCNPNKLKFEYKNGEMYCKKCGSICKKYREKILVFIPYGIKKEQLIFFPNYLHKDIKTYEQTILNSYLTISRVRNTGIQVFFNKTNYNIDIDFLWATYLSNFSQKEKLVVSSNKSIYQLFLTGVLERCLVNESKTILLATPYIDNLKNIVDNPLFINNPQFRKLAILLSIRWKNKNIMVDETLLKFLKKLNDDDLNLLYSIVCTRNNVEEEFFANIEGIIKDQFNMQNNIKALKRERK